MDHRQAPCPDSDFDGYRGTQTYAPPLAERMTLDASAPIVTGEYKVPWPPKSTLHRHPSEFMLWIIFALIAFEVICSVVGLVVVVRWLF